MGNTRVCPLSVDETVLNDGLRGRERKRIGEEKSCKNWFKDKKRKKRKKKERKG